MTNDTLSLLKNTLTLTHVPPTRSNVIVIHPSSDAVTSISLAIVSFSLGWSSISLLIYGPHGRALHYVAACIKVPL